MKFTKRYTSEKLMKLQICMSILSYFWVIEKKNKYKNKSNEVLKIFLNDKAKRS